MKSNTVAIGAAEIKIKRKVQQMTKKNALLIFPHQLFQEHPLLDQAGTVYVVEEPLFFSQYPFHKQKLVYHRASMQFFADYLRQKKREVVYISHKEKHSDVRRLLPWLKKQKHTQVYSVRVTDNYLERRLKSAADACALPLHFMESPQFLCEEHEVYEYFKSTLKKFNHGNFYVSQRQKLGILLEEDGSPVGGKWSFDTDNRKKYPKNKLPPKIRSLKSDAFFAEAVAYVHTHFPNNPGEIGDRPLYPHTHKSAQAALIEFLEYRFEEFGLYEDAIVDRESFLNHSILSPMLNNGLLTPRDVIEKTLEYSKRVPINSLEGFIRQVIGWREFIRGIYLSKGSVERIKNFFSHTRKLSDVFYTGSTGVLPIDQTIHKLLKTGYNHHIERLMVLGNFMLLCEIHPDAIYQWFMELYIDAYDWVMVPNVYGMSQFADGGIMSTKPYISGSNYLRKMSNYPGGDWEEVWNGLYWRFIEQKKAHLKTNYRMKFMVNMLEKMDKEKKMSHFRTAETFLSKIT